MPACLTRVGPRQTGAYGMVIPRFVGQALKNEPLTVYGDGSQTRTFTDVKDVVWAFMRLVEHENAFGGVFNVGGMKRFPFWIWPGGFWL